MAKYDVFISYSRKNSDIVNLVARRLKKEGLNIWIDEDGIESGDLFKKVITTAIENSACLLFFSSEASNKSSWTSKEIGIAIYEGIPVIPVILDDSKYNPEIKFDLVNRDFVNMKEREYYDKSIARIIKSIHKLLSRQETEIHTSDNNETIDTVKVLHNIVNEPETPEASPIGDKNRLPDKSSGNIFSSFKQFIKRAFSYRQLHITLFVCLLIFGGITGLIFYPFILVTYYEIRRKNGKEIPEFYKRHRGKFIVSSCIFYLILLILILYLFLDTTHSHNINRYPIKTYPAVADSVDAVEEVSPDYDYPRSLNSERYDSTIRAHHNYRNSLTSEHYDSIYGKYRDSIFSAMQVN